MNKSIITLLVAFFHIGAYGQVNFPDETDSKNFKIEYRVFAGNDLSRLRSYFEDTVFSNSGLSNFLQNDSRKGNSMILFRILKKKDENGKIQKIEFYTNRSGTTLFKTQTVLALPGDKTQIDFLAKISLLEL